MEGLLSQRTLFQTIEARVLSPEGVLASPDIFGANIDDLSGNDDWPSLLHANLHTPGGYHVASFINIVIIIVITSMMHAWHAHGR